MRTDPAMNPNEVLAEADALEEQGRPEEAEAASSIRRRFR